MWITNYPVMGCKIKLMLLDPYTKTKTDWKVISSLLMVLSANYYVVSDLVQLTTGPTLMAWDVVELAMIEYFFYQSMGVLVELLGLSLSHPRM